MNQDVVIVRKVQMNSAVGVRCSTPAGCNVTRTVVRAMSAPQLGAMCWITTSQDQPCLTCTALPTRERHAPNGALKYQSPF